MSEKIVYLLLPLFCFMIPISTFGTNFCLFGLVLFWLLTGDYQKKIGLFWQHPIARVFLIFLIGSVVSLFFTIADTNDAIDGMKDSLRLSFVGVLIYYFTQEPTDKLKKICIQAFIFAMLITVVLSYLKYFFHLLPYRQGFTEAAVFKNHIKTSFFMCMAVYFMINQVRYYPKKSLKNIFCWLSILIMAINILFLSEGRVGYVIFACLTAYYFWDRAKVKGIIVMGAMLCMLILISQQFSLKIDERIKQIPQDLELFETTQNVKTSSIGSRLNFFETSYHLILEKPWFGWGVGGFKQAYRTQISDENLQTDNPHNEYLRIGVEFGVFGIGWLIYSIISVYAGIKRLALDQQFLMKGIWAAFLIGCFANSWLMDFSEGMFIVLMLSMFLGKTHAHNVIDHRHNIQLATSA